MPADHFRQRSESSGLGAAIVWEIEHDCGLAWVTVHGHLDAATAPALGNALASLAADVVLDCTGLVGLDRAGVAVLVDTACTLAATDQLLTLVRVAGAPRQLLESLDVTEVFGLATVP